MATGILPGHPLGSLYLGLRTTNVADIFHSEQRFWDVPPVIAAVPWLTAEVSVQNAMPWVVIGVRKTSQTTAVSVFQVG